MSNISVVVLNGEIPYGGKAGHVIKLLEKEMVNGVWDVAKKFHAFDDKCQIFTMVDSGQSRRIYFKNQLGDQIAFKCGPKYKTLVLDPSPFEYSEGIVRAIFVRINDQHFTGSDKVELGGNSWEIPPVLKFESAAHCHIYQQLISERMVSIAEMLPDLIDNAGGFELPAGTVHKLVFNGDIDAVHVGQEYSTRNGIVADLKNVGEQTDGSAIYEDEDYTYRKYIQHHIYPINPLTAVFVQGIPCGADDSGIAPEPSDVITTQQWKQSPQANKTQINTGTDTMTIFKGKFVSTVTGHIKRMDPIHTEILERLTNNPVIDIDVGNRYRLDHGDCVHVIKPYVGTRQLVIMFDDTYWILEMGDNESVKSRIEKRSDLNCDVKASWQWVIKEEPVEEAVFEPLAKESHRINLDGDNGDTYSATFESPEAFAFFKQYDSGRWLRAAYSLIDRQGLRFPGETIDIGLVVFGNESMICFVQQNGNSNYYRIKPDGGTMIVIPPTHLGDVKLVAMFFVTMRTGYAAGPVKKVDEVSSNKPVTKTWIPSLNQFVIVEGEKELFRIKDFDAVEGKFIVARADSTRSTRKTRQFDDRSTALELIGNDPEGYLVDYSMIRPLELTYNA